MNLTTLWKESETLQSSDHIISWEDPKYPISHMTNLQEGNSGIHQLSSNLWALQEIIKDNPFFYHPVDFTDMKVMKFRKA